MASRPRGGIVVVVADEPDWTPSDVEMIMLALMRIGATLEKFLEILGEDDDDEPGEGSEP